MVKVSELFEMQYGNGFVLSNLEKTINQKNAINFVSRTAKNNGVSDIVNLIDQVEPFNAGLITVALGGSVLETFVQPKNFYTGYHIMVLTPKTKMSLQEKLYYAICIRANKYRYNYGRQANRTLKDIELPDDVPSWVYSFNKFDFKNFDDAFFNDNISLNTSNWKEFKYEDLFDIKKGKRLTKSEMKKGTTPYIGAVSKNNGITDWISQKPIHHGNTITVAYDGSIGEAFYQENPFWCSDAVNVLYPKFELNPYIAFFLITLIRREKYRFNYGLKWKLSRMNESIINLPVDENNTPDWEWIEYYVKTLKYSANLE
jgi:hypothetical protein